MYAVIRSKSDYGSFLFVLDSRMHRKKFNFVLSSCLRTILGTTYSTTLAASLEMEYSYLPIELRR